AEADDAERNVTEVQARGEAVSRVSVYRRVEVDGVDAERAGEPRVGPSPEDRLLELAGELDRGAPLLLGVEGLQAGRDVDQCHGRLAEHIEPREARGAVDNHDVKIARVVDGHAAKDRLVVLAALRRDAELGGGR